MGHHHSLLPSDRRVLDEVRRRATNGVFQVSQGTLAAATGLCQKTVTTSFARLRDAGILRVERLSRPTAYAIDASALPSEVGE